MSSVEQEVMEVLSGEIVSKVDQAAAQPGASGPTLGSKPRPKSEIVLPSIEKEVSDLQNEILSEVDNRLSDEVDSDEDDCSEQDNKESGQFRRIEDIRREIMDEIIGETVYEEEELLDAREQYEADPHYELPYSTRTYDEDSISTPSSAQLMGYFVIGYIAVIGYVAYRNVFDSIYSNF